MKVCSGSNLPIPGRAHEGLESARFAGCRASQRGSLDRTDSSHSTVAAATALHARSCRSQRRPRVAELGGRLGAKGRQPRLLHPLQMAKVSMARQMFADHPLADRPAAGTGFPGRSGAGVRCEATREEVFLDGGSTACRARRAVPRLAHDTYRRDPGRTIAGRSGG